MVQPVRWILEGGPEGIGNTRGSAAESPMPLNDYKWQGTSETSIPRPLSLKRPREPLDVWPADGLLPGAWR